MNDWAKRMERMTKAFIVRYQRVKINQKSVHGVSEDCGEVRNSCHRSGVLI